MLCERDGGEYDITEGGCDIARYNIAMTKRDAGRGLTDRKICLAITVGISLGVVLSLSQVFKGVTRVSGSANLASTLPVRR